jgi:2,5-diamino-6-(ribosylamino)-4(3H)-pyrimidinone 5'-phosphate reductase
LKNFRSDILRPNVILNAAITLDGKIATKIGNSEISGTKDLIRVHKLRKEVDAIMIGINTVLVDDPRLTVHKIDAKKDEYPIRIVIDSKARTPIDSRILNKEAPTIIAISENANKENVINLMEKAEIMKFGINQVDLEALMEELSRKGISNLMLEGGSTLNFSMLKSGLVDEVRVCVAPMIVGGKDAKTLADGDGFELMGDAIKLKLKKNYILDGDVILEYSVL